MLARTTYHIMAVNLIERALEKGAMLQNNVGAAYGGKAEGKPFYHAIRKLFKGHDGKEECKTEYEGVSAKAAAEKLTEICGPFEAIGLAVKWYREHPNEPQPTFNS
jgi:hypothetical protein